LDLLTRGLIQKSLIDWVSKSRLWKLKSERLSQNLKKVLRWVILVILVLILNWEERLGPGPVVVAPLEVESQLNLHIQPTSTFQVGEAIYCAQLNLDELLKMAWCASLASFLAF